MGTTKWGAMGLFEAAGSRVIESPAGTAKLHRAWEHEKRGRHRPALRGLLQLALLVDVLGAAVPVGVLCAATRQPHPLLAAALAGAAWLAVAAAKNRYVKGSVGDSGSVLPVFRDWLTTVGVFAVACLAARVEISAEVWVLALLPCLVVTVVRRKLMHRYLLAIRRQAQGLRRVLIVGESGAVDVVLAELAHRTDHEYIVVGSCLVGDGATDSALPFPARLAVDGATPEGADGR